MKAFFAASAILLMSFSSQGYAQKNSPADSSQFYFQQLFDSTRSDLAFLLSLGKFQKRFSVKPDRTAAWHNGQTDYFEQFFGDYQTFSSVTYYNSSNAVLHVNQLLYKKKVIRYDHSGGDYHTEFGLIPDPSDPSVRSPGDAESFQAYYNYELGIGVKVSFADSEMSRQKMKRKYFRITPENTPQVFIEHH